MIGLAVAAIAGVFFWTFAEYCLHRFVFHGPRGGGIGAREHRRHHVEVDYFAPWWQKGLAALGATAVMLPLSGLVAGALLGLAFTAGFISMFLLYEVLHRRAHTHPPRGRYGRWLRRNHFAHHFTDSRQNQGVTTPLWDVVFGTGLPSTRIRVPRQLAMPWLVRTDGEIAAAFAGDYELREPAAG